MSHLQPVPDAPEMDATDRPGMHDPAAERSVLGSALLAPKVIADILEEGLRGDDFHAPRHETIWGAITYLADQGQAVDAVTVAHTLATAGELTRAGGPAYLHQLTAEVATPANVGFYARIVVDRAHRRRLVAAGQRISQLGMAEDGGLTDELIEAAVQEVDRVADRVHGRIRHEISDAVDEAINQLEVGIPAVPSGIPDLDAVIRGWVPGALVVIGARTSVGKSAAMMQAVLAALGRGEPCGFTSLEMGQTELIHRAAANLGRIPFDHLLASPHRPLSDAEWRAIAKAGAYLRQTGPTGQPLLSLSDRPGATVAQIRNDIKAHTRRHGRPPTVWAVDYAQLVTAARTTDKNRNREQEVSGILRALKLAAKALGTCIIVGSQVNRDGDDVPKMRNLRESGSLEQDSDIVILLHRDLSPDGDPTVMEWIVAKHRSGRTAPVVTTWEGAYQLISPKQWRASDAAARAAR